MIIVIVTIDTYSEICPGVAQFFSQGVLSTRIGAQKTIDITDRVAPLPLYTPQSNNKKK